MKHLILGLWKRVARYFIAGILAILPVVVTVAVVIWVANFLKSYVGPGTVLGGFLEGIGGRNANASDVNNSSTFLAYAIGWLVVLGVIFALGLIVELGAKSFLSRVGDSLFRRIPLVGSIYATSKQVVQMLDKKDDDALQGMTAVYCFFGEHGTTGVLAFLVSPQRYPLNDREYYIVIIPTAPIPFGGAMMLVDVEKVQPADMPIDGLMSVYLSMGVAAPQYMGVATEASSDS